MHKTDRIDFVLGHALVGALLGLVAGAALGAGKGVLFLAMLTILCVWTGVLLGVGAAVLRSVAQRPRTYAAPSVRRRPARHPRAHPRHP